MMNLNPGDITVAFGPMQQHACNSPTGPCISQPLISDNNRWIDFYIYEAIGIGELLPVVVSAEGTLSCETWTTGWTLYVMTSGCVVPGSAAGH